MQEPFHLNFLIPNTYREIDGKRYTYCGQYPKSKKLINDFKHTMFKHGFYLKVQRADNDNIIIWKRPK